MTRHPQQPERAKQHPAGGGGDDPERAESGAGASPRRLARVAGALYLINIVGGAFAIGVVQARLFTLDRRPPPTTSRPTSCSTGPASRPTSW